MKKRAFLALVCFLVPRMGEARADLNTLVMPAAQLAKVRASLPLIVDPVLADILSHRFGYRYFQSFIGVSASARNYRIAEVDTVFDQRFAGTSFLSAFPIWVSLRILVELAKVRWELRALARSRQAARDRQPDGLS